MLVLGVHGWKLLEYELHHVVLLQSLENDVLCLLAPQAANGRVEDLLLDGAVNCQLLDDLAHQLLPGGRILTLVDLPKEALDLLVLLLEQARCFHSFPVSFSRCGRDRVRVLTHQSRETGTGGSPPVRWGVAIAAPPLTGMGGSHVLKNDHASRRTLTPRI